VTVVNIERPGLSRPLLFMQDSFHSSERRIYRPRVYYLAIGVVCLAFYSGAACASSFAAWTNIDGSFRFPIPSAIFFGSFWSAWSLLSLWIILAWFRERLIIEKRTITQRGVVFTRVIQIHEIAAVRWMKKPFAGKVLLDSNSGRSLRIDLRNFTPAERDELINLLHRAAPLERQQGWHEFIKPHPVTKPLPSRAIAVICAVLFSVVGAWFIGVWWHGMGVHFLLVGVANLLAGMWYEWRAVKYRPQTDRQ
jgi:hypothetical protein